MAFNGKFYAAASKLQFTPSKHNHASGLGLLWLVTLS